jgi:hypothetical protein
MCDDVGRTILIPKSYRGCEVGVVVGVEEDRPKVMQVGVDTTTGWGVEQVLG